MPEIPAQDEPAVQPSNEPAVEPADPPAAEPVEPQNEPTENPTVQPSDGPAIDPTDTPADDPTVQPSDEHPDETPIHTADHATHEVQAGENRYRSLDKPDMHLVIRQFDLYCDVCQRVVQEAYRLEENTEHHTFIVQSSVPSTCSLEGEQTLVCSLCGEQHTEALPLAEHTWTDWLDVTVSDDPVCIREQVRTRRCQVCGAEETQTIPAPGHQWEAVSYSEVTCTEDGIAVRRCRVCGQEEIIVTPALGHTFLPSQDGSEFVCAICGAVQEQTKQTESKMFYNNTVTSFGPTTRELIGGSVWNRVTPVNLSKEGVFTYPLVASNMYTVGTATLINTEDEQVVNYKLNSPKINVHSEALVVYPDLDALKTGRNAVSVGFNQPLHLQSIFGDDANVILAITLKADYDANGAGVQAFSADPQWINEMVNMVK